MPFIIAALALSAAMLYGAIKLYTNVAAQFGSIAGIAAILICVALIVGLAAIVIGRHRAVHGVTVKGRRVLSLTGPWGALSINAEQKSGSLTLAEEAVQFVFSDIEDAIPVKRSETWMLVVRLKHSAQSEWTLPMENGREANRWAKVFSLASTQSL